MGICDTYSRYGPCGLSIVGACDSQVKHRCPHLQQCHRPRKYMSRSCVLDSGHCHCVTYPGRTIHPTYSTASKGRPPSLGVIQAYQQSLLAQKSPSIYGIAVRPV